MEHTGKLAQGISDFSRREIAVQCSLDLWKNIRAMCKNMRATATVFSFFKTLPLDLRKFEGSQKAGQPPAPTPQDLDYHLEALSDSSYKEAWFEKKYEHSSSFFSPDTVSSFTGSLVTKYEFRCFASIAYLVGVNLKASTAAA